jgi:hypothetical protein
VLSSAVSTPAGLGAAAFANTAPFSYAIPGVTKTGALFVRGMTV